MSCSHASRRLSNARAVPNTPTYNRQCKSSRCVRAAVLLENIAASPARDYIAAVAGGGAAYTLVRAAEFLNSKGILDKKDSRKLNHVLAGPGFVLTWPLFSASPWAPYFAAAVPAIHGLRLALAGIGVVKEPGLVASVSRSEDKAELLQGPLIYCFVLVAATILSWRTHLPGLCVTAMMCGGDGVADLIGRRFGSEHRIPWNTRKSWAGSVAMFSAGLALMAGLVAYFHAWGYLATPPSDAMASLVAVAAACTLVETVPGNKVDDNWSVPLVALAACQALGYTVRMII